MHILAMISVLLLLPGFWLTVQGMRQRRLSERSRTWPSVEGRITDVGVDVIPMRGKRVYYFPRIAYTYTVEGVTYTGDRQAIGDDWRTSAWYATAEEARQRVAAYTVDATVRVYYDPRRPSEATLEPGVAQGARQTLRSGLTLVAMGLLAIAAEVAWQHWM